MEHPMLVGALLALFAACSDSNASQTAGDGNGEVPAVIAGGTNDLIVRNIPTIPYTERQQQIFELIAPSPGFVFLHLRDTTRPQHDKWQPVVVGDPPKRERKSRGLSDSVLAGDRAQSTLTFHVLKQDVGRPIRLQLTIERITGKRLLDEFVAPAFGEQRADSIRAEVEHADRHLLWSVGYDISFADADPTKFHPHSNPKWARVALSGDFRSHTFGWQKQCIVPSGELRGLGFEAFLRDANTAALVRGRFFDENTSVVGFSEDPASKQYGKCSVLEIAWQADS